MKCVINNIPIYYEEYGQGYPVLCIHGYYVDHRLMSGCLEPHFSTITGYRRIYLDLPGMGQTPGSSKIKSSDDILDILIGFIERIVPDENFLLMSESYGGYLSLGLTYHFMKQVAGLFFICPAVKANQDKRILPKKELLVQEPLENVTNQKYYQDFMNMAVVATNETWRRNQQEVLPGILVADLKFLFSLQKNGYRLSCEEAIHQMKYDKPATMLLGKQDDVVGYQDMLFYLNNFSRGSFTVLDCAGHNLQIEQPQLLEAHLKAFLTNCGKLVNKASEM